MFQARSMQMSPAADVLAQHLAHVLAGDLLLDEVAAGVDDVAGGIAHVGEVDHGDALAVHLQMLEKQRHRAAGNRPQTNDEDLAVELHYALYPHKKMPKRAAATSSAAHYG